MQRIITKKRTLFFVLSLGLFLFSRGDLNAQTRNVDSRDTTKKNILDEEEKLKREEEERLIKEAEKVKGRKDNSDQDQSGNTDKNSPKKSQVSTYSLPASSPFFLKDSLDLYIERGMRMWQIPGLSITIVKDGKVILSKGYGVREIGKSDQVDENTLFIIASNSKLFTGTAIAKLDHEKKLSLNDKVTDYIPWFRLYNSTSTDLVNIRDVLCHRIGTKTFQGDFTFWNSNLPKDSIIWKMRYLKPSGEFRQDYGYCNSGFLVAGQILEKVTGKTWEAYVEQNILDPLGMNNTYMNTAGLEKRTNIAFPHNNLYSSITKVSFDKIDNLGPATSMVSNVKDLGRWLMLQLDSGRYNGKQVLPWEVIQKTRDINIITTSRKNSIFPSHFRGYGLGLFSTDYNGKQVYWHTGGAFGHVTNVCFVPEEKLGIAILTNNDNQSFFEALRYQILDAYLGLSYTDRSSYFLKFASQSKKEQDINLAKLQTRVNKNVQPPLPLDDYTGDYTNEIYGKITISKSNKMLICRFEHHPDLIGYMEYMDNNEFRTTYSNIGYGIFPAKFSIKDRKIFSVEIKSNEFVEYDSYKFVKK